MRMKILLDLDTGVDDSLALLYALHKPEMEIVGITTVCGNIDPIQGAYNTLKILDLVDAKNIPVAAGAAQPTNGTWHGPTDFIHGSNGIGNVELPDTKRVIVDQNVNDFQMELANQYEGELVLITLGPLTNIANTIRKYPDFPKKIKSVIMMGGAVSISGNVSPVSEANFAGDPQACDFVFLSGMDITVVGLDVTMKTRLKKEHIKFIDENCSPKDRKAVDYLKEALAYYWDGNQKQNYCINDCPLHDPLAMMIALNPSLAVMESRVARIECLGTYTRGMVVTDRREQPIEGNYIRFAMDVYEDRAIRELLSVFWQEN